MDFVAWIRAGLKQPGKTQHGLAKRLGRADSAISAMLRDGRHIKAEEIIPIAEYLEIDPPFLPQKRSVPIVGCIKGGVQLEVILFTEKSLAQIAVPHGTVETQAALLVEGQGMPGLMKDGWAVFYGERQSPPLPEQIGELCVCEVAGGRIVVGFLKHSLYDRLFDIETGFEQSLLAQDIKWAATVTSLVTKAAVPQLRRAAELTGR